MFLFGFARIRFAPALITTIFLVVGYEVSEALQDVSFTTVLSNNFFLLGFIVVGATTCYALESLRRREYRYEEALRGAFGTYVSHELIDRVTSGRADIEGEDVDVTILFVDIRDFTWFADHATARETVAYLNEFYALVLPVVRRHGGHANKLLGDGLLAVFGAPTPLPDHADAALRAAREILDAVGMRFEGELRVGIGINSGSVVAGTIGDPTKLDYTLIGDAVNVASRIEQLTKTTGDPILLSDDTRSRLLSAWPIHSRGHHTVRGKVRPLHVYALDVPAPPRANADAARQSSTHH
jgi:class 3 adenylate cyclase